MKIRKHYEGLDVIRGLSAIFVMLFHYTTRYSENPITEGAKTDWFFSLSWGYAAVTSFFLLSGFLGAKTLFKKDCSGKDPLVFLWNRFTRLYPSFLCALVLTFVVTTHLYPQGACSLHDALYNLTMIPSLLGVESVDGAYWTLRVEWVFYILVAFSLLVKSEKLRMSILWLWLLMSLFLFYAIEEGILKKISILFACNYSQEFIAGVCLYLIVNNTKNYLAYILLLLSTLNEYLWQDTTHFVFFCVTIAAMALVVLRDSDYVFYNPIARLLKWYSSFSYPMYLVHQMIGFTIIYYLQVNGFTSTFYLFIPILIATILGYLIHKYVEQPIIAMVKK